MGKQPYTEKRKLANAKWDKEHLRNGSYKMRIDLYEAFEKYCINNNVSKNAMINRCISDAIGYTAPTGQDVDKQN